MKRKKLYSMLALSMAMTLAVGVPVSAAPSPGTDNTDFPVVGDVTSETKDGQDVNKGKDEDGNELVQIPSTIDSTGAIEVMVGSSTTASAKNGGTLEDAEGKLKVPEADPEDKDGTLKDAGKKQYEVIKADEIKADVAGLSITVKPVSLAVQSVAKAAAVEMAAKLELNVPADKIDLMASADISIPDFNGKDSVRVTIPMTETPDTAKYDYYVLHYNTETGKWETLEASITEKGIVVATFNSTSPVFVVKAEKAADDNNGGGGDGDGGNDDSSNSVSIAKATPAANTPVNPAVSPKTGE